MRALVHTKLQKLREPPEVGVTVMLTFDERSGRAGRMANQSSRRELHEITNAIYDGPPRGAAKRILTIFVKFSPVISLVRLRRDILQLQFSVLLSSAFKCVLCLAKKQHFLEGAIW